MFNERLSAFNACLTQCAVSGASPVRSVTDGLRNAASLLRAVQQAQGIVYVIGNGGSAGIASHFASDLLKALHVPAQTLYDSNLMTCLSNDLGYENVFSIPLSKLLKPHDALVAISSSGKSPNILRAAEVAIQKQAAVITLSGFASTNPLRAQGQLNFWINATDYGLIESAHFFLLHSLVDLWHKLGNTHVENDRTFAHSQN